MFDIDWVARNLAQIWELLLSHLLLSFLPVAVGLVLAVPIGLVCVRWRWLYPPALFLSTAFFAIPSLALFILMLPYTGLSTLTAIVPLTLYTVALLVRNVVDGINSADDSVRQAAAAMGYGKFHRLVSVELPIAAPVILGGLRVATVATIGMVSVASVIGLPSLGDLFVDGAQRFFPTPIICGIVLTVALAGATDLLLVAVQRRLTPWSRAGRNQ